MFALEVAKDNALVNGVNIGFVVTPQWDNIHQRTALPSNAALRVRPH